MSRIDMKDAREKLEELIAAAERGEEVVIIRKNRPAVKLVPVDPLQPVRKAGSARGLIVISDDFDAPLEDFREYME